MSAVLIVQDIEWKYTGGVCIVFFSSTKAVYFLSQDCDLETTPFILMAAFRRPISTEDFEGDVVTEWHCALSAH